MIVFTVFVAKELNINGSLYLWLITRMAHSHKEKFQSRVFIKHTQYDCIHNVGKKSDANEHNSF